MDGTHDGGRPGDGAASNVSMNSKAILHQIGCICGHFYDEDCIRHLPVEGTGARYKAAQKRAA